MCNYLADYVYDDVELAGFKSRAIAILLVKAALPFCLLLFFRFSSFCGLVL